MHDAQTQSRDAPLLTDTMLFSGLKTPIPSTIMMVKMFNCEPLMYIMNAVINTLDICEVEISFARCVWECAAQE